MVYTLATLRTYTRSIDNRLEDADKYPDAWIDSRIEEGMAIAQETKQIFYTKEKYDLVNSIDIDGLTEMEIILQKEPYAVLDVICDETYYTVEVTPNNHIVMKVIENASVPEDRTVMIRYWFYPTMPFTDIEMTLEMYRIVKCGIAAACFDWLQDEESEQYYIRKAENMTVKGTFDLEKNLLDIPETRLWNRSWV